MGLSIIAGVISMGLEVTSWFANRPRKKERS
jgi:hypothetical protein